MQYDEIPRAMRNALGTFEMLRRMGFAPDDIFFDMREEDKMMAVVLKTQSKEFVVLVGILDGMAYEQFKEQWVRVVNALNAHEISDDDLSRTLVESEAYCFTHSLTTALMRKGIRIPAKFSANHH